MTKAHKTDDIFVFFSTIKLHTLLQSISLMRMLRTWISNTCYNKGVDI